jgi:hypothetical protein
MSLRIFSAALLLLAACSPGKVATQDERDLIDCALHGASKFTRDCVAEWRPGWIGGERGLTVRHPDGSFHRLTAFDDGRGFETADGADRAEILVRQDRTYVTVGSDRYRFSGKLALHDSR